LESVRKDRAGCEKSTEILAYDAVISHASVCILHKHGFRNVKPTWKPSLTNEAKYCRLAFALEHKYWTLEDLE
jgi:Transposase.